MAESVDAPDLKSVDHCGRGGSSPPAPTVHDDFLRRGTFVELWREITSTKFPWYFPESPGEPEQYSNLLYYDHEFSKDVTPKLKRILSSVCTHLGAICVLRIKVNATPKDAPEQAWHTDWQISTRSKTCVLYLNDCDGYTEFGSQRIDSKSNRAVIFDTDTLHRGSPSTNDRRLVLNINYFEK